MRNTWENICRNQSFVIAAELLLLRKSLEFFEIFVIVEMPDFVSTLPVGSAFFALSSLSAQPRWAFQPARCKQLRWKCNIFRVRITKVGIQFFGFSPQIENLQILSLFRNRKSAHLNWLNCNSQIRKFPWCPSPQIVNPQNFLSFS